MQKIKRAYVAFVVALMMLAAMSAEAAAPSGFSSANIVLNAQITVSCQEAQQGTFPNPIVIDTQSASEQTFAASADEKIACTNGTVFSVKVTSANGSAVNQACTSAGVSSMALKSAGSPSDTIPYTFLCAGDTDGLGNFTGGGFSMPKAVGMSIKIAAADAQAAKVHADYSDSVTLMISY